MNRYLAAFKAAFSYATLNGKAERNPVKDVKMEKENNARVRYLTQDEEARLMAVLPERYEPLVILAIHTGLRKTEQLSLEWRDIDFQQGQGKVRESKSGKGRVIPLSQTALELFRSLSKVRMINNPFVFPGEFPGTRRTDLPKYWEDYLGEAGINDFHWHDLRHTFASRLVMAGVDLYTVSKLLGHADIKMTMRYAHLSPGHLKAAVGVLDNQLTPELAPVMSSAL